ncbi:hypothetical protein ABZ912_63140 [Nonomuraea angiospora]|uniref:hypothetical protein n=1 Tax=Nonomuraea angiospora TaxID=46172 RepID=UPI0033BFF6FF
MNSTLRPRFQPEDVHLGNMLGQIEVLRSGITNSPKPAAASRRFGSAAARRATAANVAAMATNAWP